MTSSIEAKCPPFRITDQRQTDGVTEYKLKCDGWVSQDIIESLNKALIQQDEMSSSSIERGRII